MLQQPPAGHATASTRGAANDDPSVRVKILRGSFEISKGNISTTDSVSDGEFSWRTDIDDHGARSQQRRDLPTRDDLGDDALEDDDRDERHHGVLNDMRR